MPVTYGLSGQRIAPHVYTGRASGGLLANIVEFTQCVCQQVDLPLVRGSAAGNVSVETLCTKGLLVAAPAKLGDAAQAALQQIIDYDWMRVYPQSR